MMNGTWKVDARDGKLAMEVIFFSNCSTIR